MNNFSSHILIVSVILMAFGLHSCSSELQDDDFTQRVKVALRSVGNDVLLSQEDSTSLVKPVLKISPNVYEVTFEDSLAFDPGILSAAVANAFTKAQLPKSYRVEVMSCSSSEIVYSFQMDQNIENSLVPCGGRIIPKHCYSIQVAFTQPLAKAESKNELFFYILVGLVLLFLFIVFYSKIHAYKATKQTQNATTLGSFRFYPKENKLVKEAREIALSNKECELLVIFAAQPNQVIKREELTKKVWEDNGVIVGRSLDTYISKLRKKLQQDEAIKLTNVHGVGYKLEVEY